MTKKIRRIPAAGISPALLEQSLSFARKKDVRDLIPDLATQGGYIVDKIEGLAIFEDRTAWISADNDGADENSGETFFGKLAPIDRATGLNCTQPRA